MGNMVLVKNHVAKAFDPKYIGPYRVLKVQGNQLELRHSQTNKLRKEHVKHVKLVTPSEEIEKQLPAANTFGRGAKLRLNPANIPDLKWEEPKELDLTQVGLVTNMNETKDPLIKGGNCLMVDNSTIACLPASSVCTTASNANIDVNTILTDVVNDVVLKLESKQNRCCVTCVHLFNPPYTYGDCRTAWHDHMAEPEQEEKCATTTASKHPVVAS